MSNLEAALAEVACSASHGAGTEVLHPREVPLGGARAIRVRRTLPQRERSLIGAWCFIDHYGPVSASMDVPPHPHTGLQTVSWLFSGEVEHRDGAGVHAVVRPGELNLMTAGAGICHSEVSVESRAVLHGIQLGWRCLLPIAKPGETSRTMCPHRCRYRARWRASFSDSWPAAVRRCIPSLRYWAPRSISTRTLSRTSTSIPHSNTACSVIRAPSTWMDRLWRLPIWHTEALAARCCICATWGIGPRACCCSAVHRSPTSW